MQSVPKVIQYGSVKPRGFATKYKRWEVNPQASYNTFSNSELVRFSLQTDGWIDPYSSYIQIEVETDSVMCGGSSTDPVHLELDGQSTSLIQQMIIYSDSKEIERMDEYDQVGQILNDLALQNLYRAHKSYEGMAFEKNHTNYAQVIDGIGYSTPYSYYASATDSQFGCYKSYARPTNLLETKRQTVAVSQISNNQLTNNLRSASQLNTDRASNVQEKPTIYGIDGLDTEFGVEHQQNICQGYNDVNPDSCINYGLKAGNCQSLSGNKSQYLNDNVNTLKIINGKLIRDRSVDAYNTVVANSEINKQRFIVPLLSGLMGILIPTDQWKLIPGKALKNLMIEFRLNPYAFFTSGHYHNISGNLQKRGWRVTSFKMIFDIWNFDDNVERIMDQALQGEGIILSSSSWSLGPMYQIIANGTVTNNWQINNGVESVKTLLFWFISNDYLIYPHCRKHFRLSMNLLQYQLKIGGDFIPPYPIKGHAGNIAMNSSILEDNTEFIVELHKSFGFFFSAQRSIKINKLNFAINERSYNPALETMTSLQLGCGSQTSDTPLRGFHYPIVEERRVQGKALYAINLDSNPNDADVLSGLDTTQKRPIELVIKGSDNDKFPRDATMYVMLNHDFYVQFTAQGTRTYGQG